MSDPLTVKAGFAAIVAAGLHPGHGATVNGRGYVWSREIVRGMYGAPMMSVDVRTSAPEELLFFPESARGEVRPCGRSNIVFVEGF